MQILRLSDYPQYKEMAAQWFSEKCGWRFLTLVKDEEGEMVRMYVADTF